MNRTRTFHVIPPAYHTPYNNRSHRTLDGLHYHRHNNNDGSDSDKTYISSSVRVMLSPAPVLSSFPAVAVDTAHLSYDRVPLTSPSAPRETCNDSSHDQYKQGRAIPASTCSKRAPSAYPGRTRYYCCRQLSSKQVHRVAYSSKERGNTKMFFPLGAFGGTAFCARATDASTSLACWYPPRGNGRFRFDGCANFLYMPQTQALPNSHISPLGCGMELKLRHLVRLTSRHLPLAATR